MITKLDFTHKKITSYAIRKLTPRECFRLQGVREPVIDVMQTKREDKDEMVISASQQYKQAGNSITVDVLKYIYEQLWFPKPKKPKQQLDMFDAFFPEDILPETPPQFEGKKILLTTFSGYDSQAMAMDVLKQEHPEFDWELVGWSDIDPYACKMHDLVFPGAKENALGDITKIEWCKVKESLHDKEIDLFTYSSPCQDISQAGKQAGLEEGSGSRSALLWYVADAVEILKPRYLLQENVAALVSEKFMPDFKKWLDRLDSLGYISRWDVLNTKDYGVPQNRQRVFCLSMRKDVAFDYEFPEPFPLEKKLEDVLEDEVEERYFLNDNSIGKFLKANNHDTAIFIQVPLPPTHEDAMFIKTWMQRLVRTYNVWDMPPVEAEEKVNGAVVLLMDSLKDGDWHNSPLMEDEDFISEYKANLERK